MIHPDAWRKEVPVKSPGSPTRTGNGQRARFRSATASTRSPRAQTWGEGRPPLGGVSWVVGVTAVDEVVDCEPDPATDVEVGEGLVVVVVLEAVEDGTGRAGCPEPHAARTIDSVTTSSEPVTVARLR
jgi:hypothetical protein